MKCDGKEGPLSPRGDHEGLAGPQRGAIEGVGVGDPAHEVGGLDALDGALGRDAPEGVALRDRDGRRGDVLEGPGALREALAGAPAPDASTMAATTAAPARMAKTS